MVLVTSAKKSAAFLATLGGLAIVVTTLYCLEAICSTETTITFTLLCLVASLKLYIHIDLPINSLKSVGTTCTLSKVLETFTDFSVAEK